MRRPPLRKRGEIHYYVDFDANPSQWGSRSATQSKAKHDRQATLSDVELDYNYLTQQALKKVVYDVLVVTAELKAAPGNHHFFIEFLTKAEGVSIPDHLHDAYPERMTIVLQHQFGDLIVDDDGFAVTLWFKGIETRLEIPFEAVISFADPSVQFGLRFDTEIDASTAAPPPPVEELPKKDDAETKSDDENDGTGDVVQLDAFRKK